jgi:phosphoglycolate phosphatase-like HAD superfamily hydrolase
LLVEQVIFDFDGVILDSVDLKTRAFAAVYEGADATKIAAVVAYHEKHGGVSRREKFVHFERTLFGRPGDAASVDALCRRFAAIVDAAMPHANFIPGARRLLAAWHGKARLHVVSGMPDGELRSIVAARGLAHYFDLLIGAPTPKLEAFRRILAQTGIPPERTLAIGDSTTEFAAAEAVGAAFLAVVAPGKPNRFPAAVPVLENLEGAEALIPLLDPPRD